MVETKQINTVTSVNTSGNDIFIRSEYFSGALPNTIFAFLANSVGSQDSVSYKEGEGMIQMLNSPDLIDYYIDGNGNLIELSATGDSSNYSIDANGNLKWDGDDGL